MGRFSKEDSYRILEQVLNQQKTSNFADVVQKNIDFRAIAADLKRCVGDIFLNLAFAQRLSES
jgi:hypothetical protein